MHQGKLVFAQLMVYLPLSTFRRCVADHRGEHKVKDFSCLGQFFAMAFAQLTYRESLRDIEVNLRAQARRLYHMGFRCQTISRNTLANANATRPWQIYADFAQHLIGTARPLYATEPFALDLGIWPRVLVIEGRARRMDVRVPTMPYRAPLVLHVECSSQRVPFDCSQPNNAFGREFLSVCRLNFIW